VRCAENFRAVGIDVSSFSGGTGFESSMKNIYSDSRSINVEAVKLEIENCENIFSNLKHEKGQRQLPGYASEIKCNFSPG
jgi:hypothetical protein